VQLCTLSFSITLVILHIILKFLQPFASVVTVTATGTGTATAVFVCDRTSNTTEVEIGASDGVAGQCITFITRVVNG